MALLMMSTQRVEHSLADGWTLNTTALPAAIIEIVLLMMVDVGFVDGVIEPMTPKGARSNNERPWSPVLTSALRTSVPGVLLATRRFLTTLFSGRPKPVSRCGAEASDSLSRRAALRMLARMSFRLASVSASRAWKADCAA